MEKLDIINPFNALVYHKEIVSSTMDVSYDLASAGEKHGTVIAADFQETGRGRIKDRVWEMEREINLPFTILLKYSKIESIPPALTLRAGLALTFAIEDFLPELQGKVFVKWPNDIMIGGKKTAGILCEAAGGNVHLGIGINVAQKEFPPHLKRKATSIALEIESGLDPSQRFCLLKKILTRLFDELETRAGENWKKRLEERLYKKGELVIFIEGSADSGREIRGCITGIGDNGELLILPEGDNILQAFITGELKFPISLC